MAVHRRVRDAFGRQLSRTMPHSEACPDCDATLTMQETSPGVFVAVIEHDDTCPTFRRMRGRD